MIEQNLGLPIDIHGGGIDLVFPHHENEIAQGVCAHGHSQGDHAHDEYARYWMHNGFLTVDAEKMSKSVGNVLLLHDLVQAMPGEVVRWALLSAHYRQPLDWNQGLLDQSRKNLDRLYGVLRDADAALADFDAATLDEAERELAENALDPVLDALEDDLNTPGAIAQLFGLGAALRDLLNDAEADINDIAMARWRPGRSRQPAGRAVPDAGCLVRGRRPRPEGRGRDPAGATRQRPRRQGLARGRPYPRPPERPERHRHGRPRRRHVADEGVSLSSPPHLWGGGPRSGGGAFDAPQSPAMRRTAPPSSPLRSEPPPHDMGRRRTPLTRPADQLVRQRRRQIAVGDPARGDLPATQGRAGVRSDHPVHALGVIPQPGQRPLRPDPLVA